MADEETLARMVLENVGKCETRLKSRMDSIREDVNQLKINVALIQQTLANLDIGKRDNRTLFFSIAGLAGVIILGLLQYTAVGK